jgi:solute carrier family 25 (mitochondrial carnitine/acylcarnitine transporter), member 20/29
MGGLAAGIVGTIIGFPLDLVKTRMQTAPSAPSSGSSNSSSGSSHGIFQTATSVVRNEGILALYKGIVPPLISLSILNTMTFTTYSYFQQSRLLQAERNAWDIGNAMAGAACGVLASPISTVENLVKTQLQLDNVKKAAAASAASASGNGSHHHVGYKNTWDCVQHLMTTTNRNTGSSSISNVLLLYKGHGVNTAREMVFLSTYFYLYEGFRHVLVEQQHDSCHDQNNSHSSAQQRDRAYWAIPLAGGLAGASAWAVSFPLDCIRAGVQGQDFSRSASSSSSSSSISQSHKNNNILSARQVFYKLLATKGIRGLYAGVTPSLARAFLVSGSRFSAYEGALWLVRGGR